MHRLAPFRWTAIAILLLALVLEVVNGRFWLNDLRVYVMAADALRHGQMVYGLPFGLGTGFYKYAPAVLYLFLPYTLVPFGVACVFHYALISAALLSIFQRVERLLMRHVFLGHPPRLAPRALIGFLCIAVHLIRELHMGNVNVLLLWCILGAVEALLEERRVVAGLLLGIAVLVKPYLLLCVVPIALVREWTTLRIAFVTIVCGLVLPLVLEGPVNGWSLTVQWLEAMRAHGGYLSSANTLRSLVSTLTSVVLPAWTDLLFTGLAASLVAAVTFVMARTDRRGALFVGVALSLAIIPLLVITDVQHFLIALPLILWTLATLFQRPSAPLAVLFTLSMLAYGTDSTDLWGRDLAERLEQAGLVGWGALLLVVVAVTLVPRADSPSRSLSSV